MLILNTRETANVPLITNAAGDVDLDFLDFSIDNDAQVYRSCSITWGNDFYVYGGLNQTTQISKVTECRLERVGTLAFEHNQGDCVNVADELIYICFDENNTKQCRVGSSPIGGLFNEIALSHYYHKRVDVILSILYLYFN